MIAYTCVGISFLVLRYREPNMVRPFRVPAGKLVGMITIVLSFGLLFLYMPGMPSALTGIEWVIFLGWTLFGVLLYLYSMSKNPGRSKEYMDAEIVAVKEMNVQWLKENKLL